ncbi:MAG: YraN family protein [Alphaproteobacteria bacterium]|nr:YraN family protein [Alphaproteobacteria bacterium]
MTARTNSERRREAEKRGRRSETLAALFLRLKGYRILERRLKTPMGEIDMVALSPLGMLCFIEVKQRETGLAAIESVGPRQQGRIVRAANHYMARKPRLGRKGVRYDIVTVAPGGWPRHIRNAWRAETA